MILSAVSKKNDLPLKDSSIEKFMEQVAKKFNQPSVEDLIATIGYGGIMVSQVVPKVRDFYLKEEKKKEKEHRQKEYENQDLSDYKISDKEYKQKRKKNQKQNQKPRSGPTHFLFYLAMPTACQRSQTRDGTHATAVIRATAVTILDP